MISERVGEVQVDVSATWLCVSKEQLLGGFLSLLVLLNVNFWGGDVFVPARLISLGGGTWGIRFWTGAAEGPEIHRKLLRASLSRLMLECAPSNGRAVRAVDGDDAWRHVQYRTPEPPEAIPAHRLTPSSREGTAVDRGASGVLQNIPAYGAEEESKEPSFEDGTLTPSAAAPGCRETSSRKSCRALQEMRQARMPLCPGQRPRPGALSLDHTWTRQDPIVLRSGSSCEVRGSVSRELPALAGDRRADHSHQSEASRRRVFGRRGPVRIGGSRPCSPRRGSWRIPKCRTASTDGMSFGWSSHRCYWTSWARRH